MKNIPKLKWVGSMHEGIPVATDNLDACILEEGKHLLRIVARGLDDFYAALDDDPNEPRVIRGIHGGEKCQIHTEGLVRHVFAAGYFVGELFGRALCQTRNYAEPTGVRDSRCHLCQANVVHPALDDRVFDSEHFSNTGFHSLHLP